MEITDDALRLSLPLIAVLAGLVAPPLQAAGIVVAVAANFAAPAEEIAAAFTGETGHDVRLSFGSTGALYAQIAQGAPFAVFLAADDVRPARAVEESLGVPGTVFTYAIGKSVLYSPLIDLSDGGAALRAGDFAYLAIADPETAPYGAAAMQAIEALRLTGTLGPKLVTGQNVSQALQFVDSGNAEIGFVSLSQVIGKSESQFWLVPPEYYFPIRQDAVLLRPGEANEAALDFVAFLTSGTAHEIIGRYGYDIVR